MTTHRLDPYPIPKEKVALYINEPWLTDDYIREAGPYESAPQKADDNIRIYIPMDLNREAILNRLHMILIRYEEVNEHNEFNFAFDVGKIINQVEIYDQVWYVRHMPDAGDHSLEAKELIKEIIARLEEIPDGGAELEPYTLIDELYHEYLPEQVDDWRARSGIF